MLFRPEASRARHRLHGEVSLAPPVGWQLLGFFLGIVLVVAFAFLCLATYGRRVTAPGTIAGDKGVIRIAPTRTGTLSRLLVREGQAVAAGQVLAQIAFATAAGGSTLEARRSAAIATEMQAAGDRGPAMLAAAHARIAALQADQQGSRRELIELRAQMVEQDALVRAAGDDLDRAREIAGGGFVSGRDLRLREQTLAERRQAMMRMRGDAARLAAQAERDAADMRREQADLAAARADAARTRGQLAATAAGDDAQSSIDIASPVAGRVTGLTSMVGERVPADGALLSIVPAGTHLIARLAVPVAGVGFVRPGQRVAIALDAFPRELFGTLPARIAYVTAASIPDGGRTEPAFIAEAPLEAATVAAYGARYPLRPGMTLSATITTRRLGLLRWLLDPLFAVARR